MFGGVGLYAGGAFFGVIDDDQLFFRVDDDSRPAYRARGAKPFAPMANEKPMMGYFEVPAEVLDDRETLGEWARGAVMVAMRTKGSKGSSKGREGSGVKRGRRRG